METVHELSDPDVPLTYRGTLVAKHESQKQQWILIDTAEHDEMLFIDGQHQSSLTDEYYYHESFVHTLMTGVQNPKRVLLLGGAEGCLAREVLRYRLVEVIDQVDWDSTLVEHFKGRGGMHWNDNAYADPRVTVYCEEALGWLENCTETYDVIFVDLLDPSAETMKFMEKIILASKKLLHKKGGIAVNAGCIKKTGPSPACDLATFMREEFPGGEYQRLAVKTFVPSYLDEWCFLMIVPKIWSSLIHSVEIVKGVKRFNKEILIHSVTWKDAYPRILRNFWKDFDDAVDDKKLVDGLPQYTPRDITEYYGC